MDAIDVGASQSYRRRRVKNMKNWICIIYIFHIIFFDFEVNFVARVFLALRRINFIFEIFGFKSQSPSATHTKYTKIYTHFCKLLLDGIKIIIQLLNKMDNKDFLSKVLERFYENFNFLKNLEFW